MNPNVQDGGTTGVLAGQLKRRLKPVTFAFMSSAESASGSATVETHPKILLKNLFGTLRVHVSVGLVPSREGDTIRPDMYPAFPGTFQLTGITRNPEGMEKMYLRPLFQDPSLAANENHPLPQNIPYGWEFVTSADEVEIAVDINDVDGENPYAETQLNGQFQVQVSVEYLGNWWDVKAVNYSLSQVTMTPINGPPTFFTGTPEEPEIP